MRDTWAIIGVFVAATAISIAIMLYLHSLNRDDIRQLSGRVDMLRTGIDAEIRGLSGRMDGLHTRIDEVTGRLSEASEDLGSINASVTELKTSGVGRLETSITDVSGELANLKAVVETNREAQFELNGTIARLEERSISLGSLVSLAVEKIEGQQYFVGHERDDVTKSFTYSINPITGSLHYFDSLTGQSFLPKNPLYYDPGSGKFVDNPLWR